MKAAAGEAVQRAGVAAGNVGEGAVFAILGALSFCHLLNDMIASLVPAIYPLFKNSFAARLRRGRAHHADLSVHRLDLPAARRALHRSPAAALFAGGGHGLHARWGWSCCRVASSFAHAALAPPGSSGWARRCSIPKSSRVARMASGGQHGLAQSLFQVGGNVGSSLGPLLAAFIVIPRGQGSIAWFTLAALLAMVVLARVGHWYKTRHHARRGRGRVRAMEGVAPAALAQGRLVAGGPAGADLLEVLLHGRAHELSTSSI